jgi:hypothetical protein
MELLTIVQIGSGALFKAGGKSHELRRLLLKANAQAVPTYPMSCFKLPASVCKKMKNYISNY